MKSLISGTLAYIIGNDDPVNQEHFNWREHFWHTLKSY